MSEIITASAVRFNALPTAHDGYTLLYEDNRVCQSDVKLSELVGDMSAYLTEEKANTLYQGKGDYLSASTSANFYPMTGNPSGFLTTETDWTDTIKAASANAVNITSAWVSANYYNIEEINDFLDEKYDTSSFAAVSGTFLTAHQDLSNYYTKSETSSKNELNLAFDIKQDKGNYYSASNPSGFITGVDLSNYYTKNKTSGATELSVEFSKYMEIPIGLSVNKQYGYTTTGWSEIAAGGANYSAGTDLVINNNIIGVNTYNCNVNSSNYAFVEGYQNSAMGQYSHAEGNTTYASGNYSHAEGQLASAGGRASHAEGIVTYAKQDGAHAEGWATSAMHQCSHAEGSATKADWCAHAEGHACTAFAEASHAEGYQTSAQARYSHSEGYQTSAYGDASHAEGSYTTARAGNSHAEGISTLASGSYSHAEGNQTTAKGNGSHVEGGNTIAGTDYMHVGGKFNYTSSNAAFVIGNGTGNARSDAFIVDWNGKASATTLATSGIADLEAKIKELENIISSYSGFWVLTNQPSQNNG